MLGKIIKISKNIVTIELEIDITTQASLMNLYVVFEEGNKKIVGEIVQIDQKYFDISILGEITREGFIPGICKKPSFKSIVRMIKMEELELILGKQQIDQVGQVHLGLSTLYNNYRINVKANQFLNHHFSVLGNSGSGKSFAITKIIQNIFTSSSYIPTKANILMFDAYGEYNHAFEALSQKNPLIAFKSFTTNAKNPDTEILRIPLWLLDVDDIALLLGVENQNQIPIIEKALKLVTLLRTNNENEKEHKNDIIARAIMDIIMSGKSSSKIRDQIMAVLTNFHTEELNLDTQIIEPGYTRTLKQCLFIDQTGKMQDVEIVIGLLRKFMIENLELKSPDGSVPFTISDLEKAMDFALISEGVLKSDKLYDEANVLSVRLHSLANGDYKEFFNYPEMVDKKEFINNLLMTQQGKKAQIVNFNINYVDDRFAKVLVKIVSKMIFEFSSENKQRATIPFHILIEEAHRYVQNDIDTKILGYNIFDRITKEGRKYGVLLGLISQRPSELSETALSQCSNFLILRTLHPKDLNYIKNMIPNASTEIIEILKNLQPGVCMAFGTAFQIPIMMKFEKPNPEPLSNSADIEKLWY